VRANGAGEGNFRGKITAVTHASASPSGRNPFGEVSHGIPGIRSPAAHAELSLPVPNADYRWQSYNPDVRIRWLSNGYLSQLSKRSFRIEIKGSVCMSVSGCCS